MDRQAEDLEYKRQCQEILAQRARIVAQRWRKDLDEAEATLEEVVTLRETAERRHAEALGESGKVRRAWYCVLGLRGERPRVLKELDAEERRHRDHVARLREAEHRARGLVASFTALGDLPTMVRHEPEGVVG